MRKRRFQLWLHKNYESTRFWSGMVTGFIIIFVLMGQNNTLNESIELNRKVTESQSQQLKSIINELKDDNERQTQLISCLLAIHGDSDAISPVDEAKCRKEATQQIQNNSEGINSEGQPLEPSSNPPEQPSSPPTPTPTPPQEDFDIPLVPEDLEDRIGL